MQPHIWKIEWNESMAVGIPAIDEDHQRFAALINDFNRSILDQLELKEIKRRLQLVIDDAVRHFAHEERLFKQWRYPNADDHAGKHAQVIEALQGIRQRFSDQGLQAEWIGAGQEVKDLLIRHLLTEDMKYADYYRKSRLEGTG